MRVGNGFPFWEDGIQSKDSGLEGFELSCDGSDLVVDIGLNNKYQILDFNLSTKVLTLNSSYNPLDYICDSNSSSFPDTVVLNKNLYNYSPGTEDLHLFYHCSDETKKTPILSNLTCPNEDDALVYYFLEHPISPAPDLSSFYHAILPVNWTLLEKYIMNSNSPRELFGSSFEVHYNTES